MRVFIRRRFLEAGLDIVALLIGTIISYLFLTQLVHLEIPYDTYRKNDVEQTVTIASAIGLVEDGEMVVEDEISSGGIRFLIDKNIISAQSVLKLYNRQIGYITATIIACYTLTWLIAGLICYALGIGLPFMWRRREPLMDRIDNMLHVKQGRQIYDWKLHKWVYEAEDVSHFVWIIISCVLFIIAGIWGMLLPLITILNITLAVFAMILQIIIDVVQNARDNAQRKKRKKETGKETYSLVADGSFFKVEQDQNPIFCLYLKQYWHAVIIRRIMDLDLRGNGAVFSKDDAQNYIYYGDEARHGRYELNRKIKKFAALFQKEVRIRNKQIKEGKYLADGQEMFFVSGDLRLEGIGVRLNEEENLSLLLNVLESDRKNELFTMTSWKLWRESRRAA